MYYRQAIYIPILEFVTEDLKNRFSEETLNLYNFNSLFPDSPALKDKNILKIAINQLAEKYSIFFNTPTAIIEKNIHSEIESWQIRLQREKYDTSSTAINFLQCCDSDIYPTIHTLLKIFCTLPVNAASPERIFSTLRRIKSWLRATMEENRLNGLSLLNIHNNINLNINDVINRYVKTRIRRTEFLL